MNAGEALADEARRREARARARAEACEGWAGFCARHELMGWEGRFSPYDDETYAMVLASVASDDVVLEIGAGDLRLALQLTARVRRVYALEVNPCLVGSALSRIGLGLPRNLHVTCANALDVPVPPCVTAAVLLMRHCAHFTSYMARLRESGCRRLITNARWKSSVEVIDLARPGVPFARAHEGWYACACGAVGYVGRGERPDAAPLEVSDCPACRRPH